jgi:hypothetical protein
LNQQVAHLNNRNINNLGQWWSEKMQKAQGSFNSASKKLHELETTKQLTSSFLLSQWIRNVESLTTTPPGMFEQGLSQSFRTRITCFRCI